MNECWYYLGLDLGQVNDFSALSVVEQTEKDGTAHYAARHLQRFPRGTSYPAVVARVAEVAAKLPPKSDLAIDATGVGRPVVDAFRDAGLPCRIHAVTITAGHASTFDAATGWHAPKKEIVSTLQLLLQSRRLVVAKSLPEAETLVTELANFQVKVTAAGHEQFGTWREGQHDDLLLALGLAVWLAERPVPPPPRVEGPLVWNFPMPADNSRKHEHVRILEDLRGPWHTWWNDD